MSFRSKLIITLSLLTALTFGIGGTFLIYASFTSSLQKEKATALDAFESVQNTLVFLGSLGEFDDVTELSGSLLQLSDSGISTWQAISLFDGDRQLARTGIALPEDALPSPEKEGCTYTEINDEAGHAVIIKNNIKAGDGRLTLTARFDLTPVYDARDTQIKLFFAIYLCVVPLAVLIAAALSFAITERQRRLISAVRRVAGGDLTVRSGLRTGDEFGQLSRDFDAMADKMQESISRLEGELDRQEAFMGAFAHELKTPMTSIIGYADLLRQDGLDDDTRLLAADYIHSEGRRLEKLSFKLLELLLLDKDEPSMREVNLYAFVKEIEKALLPVMKERGVILSTKSERAKVTLDPDLVKSLLYNLIDNAAKAIDGEGRIVLRGRRVMGGVCFEIADNGRGMKPEDISKITEAFYRVDKARSRSQGGAGLGLALCQKIVACHHGTMSFESEAEQGTIVTVTLYGEKKNENG